MNNAFKLNIENPVSKSNVFSKLFFGWFIDVCRKCIRYDLSIGDLYKLTQNHQSSSLSDILQNNWDEEVKVKMKVNKTPCLLKVLLKTYLRKYLMYGLFIGFQTIFLRSLVPVTLYHLLELFEDSQVIFNDDLYFTITILVFMVISIAFILHHLNYMQSKLGMDIRTTVSSLVYRKILKLNIKSLSKTTNGHIVNLLSNDVARFDLLVLVLNYIWILPMQLILITFLMWWKFGVACLAGLLPMVFLTLPFQVFLGRLASFLRVNVAEKTDTRIKLINEIVTGIQVIKMYAWEKPFEKFVKAVRSKEISGLKKMCYVRTVFASSIIYVERTATFLTILCLYLQGHNISAKLSFSIACFYNVLQLSMIIHFQNTIAFGAETLSVVKRLQSFLLLEEIKKTTVQSSVTGNISINNVYASWILPSYSLHNINIEIPSGSLCVIIGSVGSGKSSLLQLVLGELQKSSGSLLVGGTISYASQESWIFSSSVRQNIIFGTEFNSVRYKNVINVCSLERDFQEFPNRDQTLVGERGISISGGQKARINLARAIYRDADIYLLDDPLSAVDAEVGNQLFNNCIFNYLKNKTRILVTHQIQYVKNADIVIILNEGKVLAQGSYKELSNQNLDLIKMLVKNPHGEEIKTEKKTELLKISNQLLENCECEIAEEEIRLLKSPLKEYLKSYGSFCVTGIVCVISILCQLCISGSDYWLAYWTEEERLRNSGKIIENSPVIDLNYYNNSEPQMSLNNSFYSIFENISHKVNNDGNQFTEKVYVDGKIYTILQSDIIVYIYLFLIIFLVLIALVQPFSIYAFALKCSKNLHMKMFQSVLQTPINFFHENPIGRIMNRFSQDIGTIDELLPKAIVDSIRTSLMIIGIIINICVSNYNLLISSAIFGIAFIIVAQLLIKTSKTLKHLESTVKSPVFSHISATLNGVVTVRAFNTEEVLVKQFEDHLDAHSSAWFLTITCAAAFGLWLDLICIIFLITNICAFLLLYYFDNVINGSMVGLVISQTLLLNGMLQYGARQKAELTNYLTSVERVLEYTNLDSENVLKTGKKVARKTPSFTWPKQGHIEFNHVFMKYGPYDPFVLKNLCFNIVPGEKIGIVGRTGAGKSSLITALFRLTPSEGYIFIDDVDTKTLDLNVLRRAISIIPQEPILFSSTVRYNLDPFDEYDDTTLWKAIEEAGLTNAISSLDDNIQEGGSNFSLGQRQLICLARAILRNNKILVLDEATANVDPYTDTFIQSTIRRKFHNCTVLTIAHRLNTIMDSDKVLVMEKGYLVEFDHPHLLLQIENGYFSNLVSETGPEISMKLKEIAYDAFCSK